MEFWGVEVESGKPLKVTPEEDRLIHISQASLGECKSKKGETVPLHVRVGNQKLVLGTLLSESIPQLSCDLVFDTEFELSHNWGKGSVHFVGYSTLNIDDGGDDFSDSEEEEEDEQVKAPATITANGNAAKAVVKPKAKPEVDSDEEGMDVDEDDSDDEEDSEEEKEETPKKKPESSKKRANEAAPKTPVSAKKAKSEVTPKKTEEKKKGVPTAKKGGKTPTTATQSPKSASKVSCGSCKKTFVSDYALESHNKAKHSSAAE